MSEAFTNVDQVYEGKKKMLKHLFDRKLQKTNTVYSCSMFLATSLHCLNSFCPPIIFLMSSSGEIRLGGQEHFYMETQSMLVVPVGEEREFNVYISSQWPTYAQVQHIHTHLH